MSMLEEIWLGGLDYRDRPVKKGSALERKLYLYGKSLREKQSDENHSLGRPVSGRYDLHGAAGEGRPGAGTAAE